MQNNNKKKHPKAALSLLFTPHIRSPSRIFFFCCCLPPFSCTGSVVCSPHTALSMRPTNTRGTGASRTPAASSTTTSSSASAAARSTLRTPATTGSSRMSRGAGGPTRRLSTSRATNAVAAVGMPTRRPAPTAVRSAVQDDLDALADDYYGGASSTAPQPRHATTATPPASGANVYRKTTGPQEPAVASLRGTTAWYDGPVNPAGHTFDASGSNLLCMDVLLPPAGMAGGRGASPLCVVGSADHGLKVFDLASMREVKTLYTKTCGHTEWVTSCRFLSDRRVLSGGMDSKLCLWSDVTRGGPARCVDLLGHTGSISQVDVSESGGRALAMSASYDRTIRLWELSGSGGRQVGCLAGHKGPVTQFSWCETQVLSGDRQGTVKLWDAETAQCRVTASSKRGQIGSLGHLVHPAVGHLVAFGDQGGVVTVLDARAPPKAPPVFQSELHPGGMVTFLRSPSPSAVAAPLLVTCGADKRIVVRDARSSFAELYVLRDHGDFIYSMTIFGDLLLTGTGDGRLMVHKLETGELLYELDANAAAVQEIFASAAMLVAAGDDGKAKVFEFM